MGRFRCLSKPFKRYCFKYADKICDHWIEIVKKKYTKKYINKLNKILGHELYDINNFENVPGLEDFSVELHNKLVSEKGLAHSKVREYWLRRPPRLLIVLIISILITIGLAELLIEVSHNEHVHYLLISLNLLIFTVYLLYQRLIDSISCSMMRIGHDTYKNWKGNIQHLRVTCL